MRRRIWRVAKLILLGILAAAIVTIAGGLSYRGYRHHQIAVATPIDPVTGIDEELFAAIGGVDQWIDIRGRSRDNPVVLILHAGPGFAESPLPRDFLFSWTRDFTVVRWDQRGAGKTYGRSGAVAAGVTIDRMAQDGVDVAEFLRAKLRKPRILLVGRSWGSILGVKMAQARPDLFYGYVGTGQIVNPGRDEAGDTDAVESGQPSMWQSISLTMFDSPAGVRDLRDFFEGLSSSGEHFADQIEAVDVPSFGTSFGIPFFVFQGADDRVTPVPAVRDYLARITAPRKELVLIPNAGHNVMATRSDEFLKLLVDRVKPLTSGP